MFGLGFTEILVILVLVLILFGAGKLPQVMGDMGRGLKSFKDEFEGKEDKPAPKAKPAAKKKAPAKKSAAKPARKPARKKPAAKRKK